MLPRLRGWSNSALGLGAGPQGGFAFGAESRGWGRSLEVSLEDDNSINAD